MTPEEYEIMKTHTNKGAELLSRIPQMRDNPTYPYAYDIALHHHERWDGRGYPEGLVGDQISSWAQIVSLADVYDALVSKRCYKNALGVDEALAMIREGRAASLIPNCWIVSSAWNRKSVSFILRKLNALYLVRKAKKGC